ncbi:hypothetical protein GQ457_08G030920 [Hibiscus cannabinus]
MRLSFIDRAKYALSSEKRARKLLVLRVIDGVGALPRNCAMKGKNELLAKGVVSPGLTLAFIRKELLSRIDRAFKGKELTERQSQE